MIYSVKLTQFIPQSHWIRFRVTTFHKVLEVSQTNNGASRASFHETAGKMQHTERNGAAHTTD